VQPQQTRLTVAVAVGLVVLGVVIWVSAKSRSNTTTSGVAAPITTRGLNPDALGTLPNKVVTMLSVPEVIYSSTVGSTASSDAPKPPEAPYDTDAKAALSARKNTNAPARQPTPKAAHRSEDTFLVKPE
jgi:hypothetical protein